MKCNCKIKSKSACANKGVLEALDHLVTMYKSLHTLATPNSHAGHWINEAFVVRLWAILEAYHVVDSIKAINTSLPGSRKVDLCRRLRQKIAHATGNITDKESKRLDREIRSEFGLGEQKSIFSGKFILSRDTVLIPMWRECKEYCSALLYEENNNRP